MSPIKDFKLIYDAINKENAFSSGDTIKGTVTFTLTEETKIKCLYVKAKGDANVHWTEHHHGNTHGHGHGHTQSYTAHKRYYKTKEFLVAENKDGTVLSKGDHRYQFKLTIPEGNIPPSFKGYHGKIVHVVQAKMSRSWHTSSKDQKDINFVSRPFFPFDQTPQAGSVDKSVGTFSKGDIHLSATVNKRICSPGDTVHITAKITNKSSKKMKIKFKIDQKIVYRARCHAKIQNENVCKIVGETIDPGFDGDVSCPLTIPGDTKFSIHNCEIINVETYLKVYLDISFAVDPEVALPLIIAARGAIALYGQNGFPNAAGALSGPSSNDFPPPFTSPFPAPTGPPNAYGYPPPGPYPNPNMPAAGYYNPVPGYNNPMPPQAVPYGYPAAPYMPYPMQPQANTINNQFPQNQAPPTYMSLYPPSQSETDMEKKPQL